MPISPFANNHLTRGQWAYSPLELQIIFNKSHLYQFLIDSNDLYIYESVLTYAI